MPNARPKQAAACWLVELGNVNTKGFVTEGRVVYDDVIKFYYDQTNEMFGTDYAPPK